MKRWPIIRHARWLWLAWCLETHLERYAKMGAMGAHPEDEEHLCRVWRGEA